MKSFHTLFLLGSLLLFSMQVQAQSASLIGQLQDDNNEPVLFANVALYNTSDSTLAKLATSDEAGVFRMPGLAAGSYYLEATYVGTEGFRQADITLTEGQQLDLGILVVATAAVEMAAATVTAERVMVEVKPDRTVFNVQGTINSTGSDGMELMRRAPGVTVDNNDNISVLGRNGVLVYVDGKRLPISGADLTAYLQSLPAEQIDRIDIITNPGARYEAEGNAGIIDIRLKKDKNLGANGSINTTYSQGRFARNNVNANGNYRNQWMNVFASAGASRNRNYNNMVFYSFMNGLLLDEINQSRNRWSTYDFRVGTDFFLGKQHTIGFMLEQRNFFGENNGFNRIAISPADNITAIDSILVAGSFADNERDNSTYNLNYRFDNGKGRVFNVDVDYGSFRFESERYQPNRYFDANEEVLLTEIINSFDTPSDIDIYTLSADYEDELLGGKLGVGTRLNRVVSDNSFLFFEEQNGVPVRDDSNSNQFEYRENVYAAYINYGRKLSDKWNLNAGLRAELTDADGELMPFDESKQEPPVLQEYLSWFPNVGLTWQFRPTQVLNFSYGRRINRPDYNVLNPFDNQLSELSYEKGNPELRPEIVNNLEVGYTLNYRYNFKLAYSRTLDQITRLIAPDEDDPRAGFITWANLAEQTIISANISAPIQFTEKWNAYFNINANHQDNQADYGDGAVVDLQAFNWTIFQQHTFDLPWKLKGEISGYYSGPGIWGGVFEYESNWSLNVGLQRKFLNDQLNVRLAANDLFYQTGWDGVSEFDGLVSEGSGRWDSRRASISLNYQFGNQNVKSRKRETGLKDAADRVGS